MALKIMADNVKDKAFLESLAAIDKKLARKVVLKALKIGAKPMLDEVRARTPRGATGLTAKDIKTRVVPQRISGRRYPVVAVAPSEGGPKSRGYIVRWLEWGTKPRKHKKSGKSVGSMRPRPFFRSAVHRTTDKAILLIGKVIGQQIEKFAKESFK